MIAVGSRLAEPGYDLLQVLRIVFEFIPDAYVKSTKTADDAADQRVRNLVKLGYFGSDTFQPEQVAAMEREKVQRWGGVVIDVRVKGSENDFVAFLGPLHLRVCSDGPRVPNESIQAIAEALRKVGYSEIVVQ